MRFLKSVKNSLSGIAKCILSEPHMRFHIVAAFYVLVFSYFYKVTKAELAALLCVICLVMVSEAFNTAIEYICDFTCREYNRMIGVIKDIASGAVLIAAIVSVAAGVILFGDIGRIMQVLMHVFSTWYLALCFVLSVPLCAFFIFGVKNIRKHDTEQIAAMDKEKESASCKSDDRK